MPNLCCNFVAMKGAVDPAHKPISMCKRQKEWKEFAHTLSYLRKYCPSPLPVRLSFTRMGNIVLGQCRRKKSTFAVQLNDAMNQFQAADVLIHEWAHALAWNYALDRLAKRRDTLPHDFEMASHDEIWGCAYARTYRVQMLALTTFDAMTPKEKEKIHAFA